MVHPASARMRRAAISATIGTSLEYYDFLIYGTVAALVFGKLFYPGSSPTAASLAAFATFAVGFIGRPFGGLLFGFLGDRIGRKPVLLLTLLMMGVASIGIGVLPGYASIGVWAPIVLVVLRMVQGVAVGGEAAGGQLLAIEHAPEDQRGFYGSLVQAASPIGSTVSGCVLLLFSGILPQQAFLSWGWRIPFLLSVVIVATGVFVRLRVAESPAFAEVRRQDEVVANPVWTLLRTQPLTLVLTVLVFGNSVAYYLNTVYAISYEHTLGLSSTTTLIILTLVVVVALPVVPISGRLSDRVGQRPVMVWSVIGSIVVLLFYFPLIDTGNPALIFVAMLLSAVGFNFYWAVQAALIARQFDVRFRYSGMAISSAVGTVVFGGVAPFVATALLAAGGGARWPIVLYAIAAELVALGAVLGLRARRSGRTTATDPAVRTGDQATPA